MQRRITHSYRSTRKHLQLLQNGEHIRQYKHQRYQLGSLQEGKEKGINYALSNHPKFSQSKPIYSPTKATKTATEDDLTVKTSTKNSLKYAVQVFLKTL